MTVTATSEAPYQMKTTPHVHAKYNALYYLAFLEIRRLARTASRKEDDMRCALEHIGDLTDLLHTLPQRRGEQSPLKSLSWLLDAAQRFDSKGFSRKLRPSGRS